MVEPELASATARGINSLWEWGGMVTVLVLIDIALMSLCAYLFKRNAAISDRMLETVTQNTIAITTLTEVIRANSR